MRVAGGLILFVLGAVLLMKAYEQHKPSLADNSELVQARTARMANSAGGEILHAFKATHEKESWVQIKTAVAVAFLMVGLALIASVTMTKKFLFCGRHMNAAASVCRFCGEDLDAASKLRKYGTSVWRHANFRSCQ